MSDIHRPERKRAVPLRMPESAWRRVREAARADDRSMNAWLTGVVLDRLAEREAAK